MQNLPLPEKLRPKKLSEFVGQNEIAGKDGIVKKLLDSAKKSGFFPSIILWGPPGCGKTTIARIIASELKRDFHEFSAVNTATKDIQKVIRTANLKAESLKNMLKAPVIFVDEIHRFNKAQQDKLLPYVEKGEIILIGATTENPSFEIIGPLLSRSRVLVLNQLLEKDLTKILNKALRHIKKKVNKNTKNFLLESSNGDARVLLNILEIATHLGGERDKHLGGEITLKNIEQALQRRQFTFDKKADEYYNTISAFIKSMRASDTNAALYYLARMIEAGQDPLYIARRMVIFASEDIGMAQPTALVVANSVFRACETIGYPECAINLAHGVTYLTKAKKDRSAYNAYSAAVEDVKKYGNLPIPKNIRNAPTNLMKDLGYGKDYNPYTKKSLLPDKLKGKKYYKTQKN